MGGWDVEITDQCAAWYRTLTDREATAVDAAVEKLEELGPVLGRPYVDTLATDLLEELRQEGLILMAGHRKFSEVRAERARGPQYRDEVDAIKRVMDETLTLAELRQRAGVTQVQLAGDMDITQGSVSRIEHQSDLVLSTIRNYVEALGGTLELRAVFGGESLPIMALPEGEPD